MSRTPTPQVNLFDAETQRCPYDAYKTLRDEAPVYQCPATGMYVITRFDDVRQILTDTEHFTNETAYLTDATEPSPRALAVRNTFQEEGWVPAKTLNGRDDPDHKAVRSVFNDAFRPKKIEALEDEVRDLAYQLIDDFIDDGHCEWVKQFAIPLPLLKLAHKEITDKVREIDRPLLDGLEKAGFRLDFGENGTGWPLKYRNRGGGYYFNVGCSELIVDGRVKLMQYRDIEHFDANGAVLKDGGRKDAELIVLATGYKGQMHMVEKLFGDDVAGRPVYAAHHRRVRDERHLLAILVAKAVLAMNLANTVSIQIGLRGDQVNAVKRRRAGNVDRNKARMRKRRPQERNGKPLARLQIIRVPTAPGQKSRVLQPRNGLTNAEFHVRLLLFISRPTGTGETPRQCGWKS